MTVAQERTVRNGAWWTFCAGSFTCFLTGFTYTFGVWSPVVKRAYSYSQAQLDTLALAKDLGNFICMDAGLVTNRYGAHISVAGGTLVLTLTCVAIYLAIGNGSVPFPAMIILFGLFGHSLGFCDNAGISTSVRNFPEHKGSAVGLMKAMEGLTAAVVGTVFYSVYSDEDLDAFPLWLAFMALGIGAFSVPLIACTNSPDKEDAQTVSKKFSVLTVALLVYTAFCAVVAYNKAYTLPVALVVALLPWGLFALACKGGQNGFEPAGQRNRIERPNLSAWEMLHCVDFYLLYFTFVSLQGSGIMFSNNFGQIVKSVSNNPSASSGIYVTIFSIFNTFGRVFIGFGSESLKGTLNRPWFLVGASLLMSLGLALLELGEDFLGFSAAAVGFALGGTFALQAVVIEEIFGPEEMPVKYSYSFTAASVGSLLLSDLLAGCLYDAEAHRQGQAICLGSSCFGVTSAVTALCCAAAALSVAVVAFRSRGTYTQLQTRRPLLPGTEAALF
ncbi:NFD4 [Symbiodinium natans]|uniref:NFD4 protein n=1 Tax=Symbiodinium natans TaxID=878477 RepID=A0A812PFK2_9DINO|nr:NFD4 [Symbiodinium natans]